MTDHVKVGVTVYAYSLGCAVGLAAMNEIRRIEEFEGLFERVVLRAPFYSIRRLAEDMIASIPVWKMLKRLVINGLIDKQVDWNNGKEIRRLGAGVRLAILHGDNDSVISEHHSQELLHEIPPGVHFLYRVMTGLEHSDLATFDAEWGSRIFPFLYS